MKMAKLEVSRQSHLTFHQDARFRFCDKPMVQTERNYHAEITRKAIQICGTIIETYKTISKFNRLLFP